MILLLDNYDSFVHNLARYFRRLGCQTLVLRSDQISTADVIALKPQGIVISPGPHGPSDAGCSVEVIRNAEEHTPILGVCLGHQCICAAFGGRIDRSSPVHGMSSLVHHDRRGLFTGCPSPMKVGRYHSLHIDRQNVPDELVITAQTEDQIIMGIRHVSRPIFGVQFHPESILTDYGKSVIENFIGTTVRRELSVTPRVCLPYPYSEWTHRDSLKDTAS